jgi:hypothetical protein
MDGLVYVTQLRQQPGSTLTDRHGLIICADGNPFIKRKTECGLL